MRVVYYNDNNEEVLEIVAKDYGVDKEKLWGLYLEIMKRNYFEDLCDIARENEEELKETIK
jgi:hypothetical protein